MKSLIIAALLSVSFAVQAKADIYKNIYDSVQQKEMVGILKNLGGVTPVTANGKTFSIAERYSPEGKANFRAYFTEYFKALGMQVQELPYTTQHSNGETQGHNIEAVLPGASPDTILIIVHYDSIGPDGSEVGNPGVDDDMSGMAVSFETAKILAGFKGKLQHTVRFVAADYEEWGNPGLEGAYAYMNYLTDLAKKQNFKIVTGIDNEQIGWSGGTDTKDTFAVFSCGGATESTFLGDQLEAIAANYGRMKVVRDCMGENSDHYAVWAAGIPAVVYSENNPFANPHFDAEGGDTFDKIDQDYFFKIGRIGVTFAAQVVGVSDGTILGLR